MTRNYKLSHRLITVVLLFGLLLQSCNNFNQLSPQNDVPASNKQINTKQVKQVLTKGLREKGWEEVNCYQAEDGLRVKRN